MNPSQAGTASSKRNPPMSSISKSHSNIQTIQNSTRRDRSISPSLSIPVHQDLIPGSRGESALANHLYWIQRVAKEECMKL